MINNWSNFKKNISIYLGSLSSHENLAHNRNSLLVNLQFDQPLESWWETLWLNKIAKKISGEINLSFMQQMGTGLVPLKEQNILLEDLQHLGEAAGCETEFSANIEQSWKVFITVFITII